MTHLEFADYHNRKIEFIYFTFGGNELVFKGVVLDSVPPHEKKSSTIYNFIKAENLIKWKKAEENRDEITMAIYQKPIDITNIIKAKFL